MLEEKIKNSIQEVLGVTNVELEVPEREEHGDFSTNVAMQIFSSKEDLRKAQDGKSDQRIISDFSNYKTPKELAEYIVSLLDDVQDLSNFVRKIEVAGPGFINFWLTDKILIGELKSVLDKVEEYGSAEYLSGKKIMVEYGDANTHKLPHIGHLFSYIYGDSLTHILEAAGAELNRVSYQGDVGLHVAKCLWAFQKEDPEIPESIDKKVLLLQEMYQKGSSAYEDDDTVQEQIKEINKSIYDKSSDIHRIWKQTREWSIEYYKQFEKRLGIEYDRYYYESEVYQQGKRIVEENVDNIFKQSQGALIFEGSKHGLHDRVFVTQYGTPTYEAKDMYLQQLKREEWPMDKLIITTASEQNEYFKVVFKALEELDDSYKGLLKHIGFGMIQLTTGKMSSRTGNIVRGIELVDLVVEKVQEVLSDRKDLSDSEKQEISEIVGIGAVKYFMLKSNHQQNVKFDIKESVDLQGNSGPYLQYTYVRTLSVLQKANGKKQQEKESVVSFRAEQSGAEKPSPEDENKNSPRSLDISTSLEMTLNADYKLNNEELSLLRDFVHYSGTIVDAAKNYSPNLIANYLYELAQKYNTFYNKHRIVDAKEGEDTQVFRLALTKATGQVLKNGLSLLGIDVPEKM